MGRVYNFAGVAAAFMAILMVMNDVVVVVDAYLPTATSSKSRSLNTAAFHRPTTSLFSAASASSDADFSAFAESLEIDDEEMEDTATKMNNNKKETSSSSTTYYTTTSGKTAIVEKSWQAKLEELFDPMTSIAQRQILLSELLNANEKIRDSVLDAITNRKLDPLLTPTQRKLQDGTRAVVRQLANDILPQITKNAAAGSPSTSRSSSRSSSSPLPFMPPSPSDLESIGSRLFSLVSNQIQKNIEELQNDLQDPFTKIPQRLEKQRVEVLQEARNVFLETPEGLEEPPYTIVESNDLYEIRDYDGYSVASTMVKSLSSTTPSSTKDTTGSMEGVAAGQAFNVLASYLFGNNEESKSMSMTTPVTTTSSGEMRFYLAPTPDGVPKPNRKSTKNGSSSTTPKGTTSSSSKAKVDDEIEIVNIPPTRLAVRKFTGFVTDGEVARQKDTLLQALEMDNMELDVPHGAIVPHVIFQYNPPYTIPIVRRNEIAIPVRKPNDVPITSLQEEWIVDLEDSDDDDDFSNVNGYNNVAPSD